MKPFINALVYPIKLMFFPFSGLIPWRKVLPVAGATNIRRNTSAIDEPQQPNRGNINRIHVFHGTFDSEIQATDYCLTPLGRNRPEPLTRDLPDATIKTAEIEIIFGADRIRAAMPMLTDKPDTLFQSVTSTGSNTLILISHTAFCGLPYTLNDTPVLKYTGAFDAT